MRQTRFMSTEDPHRPRPSLDAHSALTAPNGLSLRSTYPGSEPHARLRLSAYDPRAVGGRQVVRLSLATEFAQDAEELELRVRCDLLPMKVGQYRFIRALNREWQSVLLSFSSRDKEHGQYPLELELRAHARVGGVTEPVIKRRWLCHSILFLPRSDASLSEIHQVFLSSQKQVRVLAEDGAIARVQHGASAGNQLQVDVVARDGALAQVQLDPPHRGAIQESTPGYLAWDEALVELAVKRLPHSPPSTIKPSPSPASSTFLSLAARDASSEVKKLPQQFDVVHRIRHHRLRVLAADVWEFGRDLASSSPQSAANTPAPVVHHIRLHHPRISGVHADITVEQGRFVLRDHSRFGISVDGQRVQKDQAHILKESELIDLCSSFPDQIVWQVVALFRTESEHAACLLRRQHEHGAFEHLCLIHATQLAPSSMQSLGKACEQLYASAQNQAYAATLPPAGVLQGQEHVEWQVYQGQAELRP
ncbi:MAG: FHA domain-containing protein [Burkholderiaceae bacterium]|nr:MAG: FHA domain-containing protein [Burkholderiaceae bacterium]